jgi:uncharacterized protein
MFDCGVFEGMFEARIREIASSDDPAHDLLHFKRVVFQAKRIGRAEGALEAVVVPAAWLHDFVIIKKDSPLRSRASQLSAEKALEYLVTIEYPSQYYEAIAHAIEAHSFSAQIEAKTLEAKVVQDADRLDGLGAIGVARCFATAGILKRPFYSDQDPFCTHRKPHDAVFTVDHFYQKLFKTAETLQTATGRAEGLRRVAVMKHYLESLGSEIGDTFT